MARFVVREGWVVQAYRYALDPSPRQERALASHAGAARVAYNWAVTWVLATWAQRKAEEWRPRRRTDALAQLVAAGAAQGVEPGQERRRPVVGGELQGGLLFGAGWCGGGLR